ncbi:MAG TPA: UDP-3-O-acyl-N-acetylglucosamine deacetylase [Candidatus Manganitrophaceae bacterium]|nr:UDP-3-O-acyl-N-acetylglucosamine deacetylase [Candidatus Manganitrophaceae bacterium]
MNQVMNQRTIQKEVSCSGIGLHSGKKVHLRLLPAPEGSGVVFIRTDLGGISIPADAAHIISTSLSTTIGAPGATVQTVEHLLAAVSALHIGNLIVELEGGEVPVLDGSAAPFVSLLQEAGEACQEDARPIIELMEPVTVSENGKYITLRPASQFEISYKIQFDHPLISTQSYFYRHSVEAFAEEIAPARTFGFLREVQSLQARGLARGGSLENAIVIGDDRILNKQGLRFSDEFVRHKILDLMGDLSLLGMPILGRIDAVCSGHMLHAKLIREILKNQAAWKVSSAPSPVGFRGGRTLHPAPPLSPTLSL